MSKIFYNAHFWNGTDFAAQIKSLVVDSGIITALAHTVPISAEAIDLKAAYVYPGFIDTHTHSFEGGLYSLGVDLSSAISLEHVFDKLAEAYHQNINKEVIFAWQLDENLLQEKRFPSLAELDKLSPDCPLVLRRIDGHSCMLNSFARAQVPHLGTKEEILRGQHNDHAVHYFHKQISPDTILQAYHAAAAIALKGGFTGIHTMIGDAEQSIGHYKLIRDNLADFAIDYYPYPQSFNLKAALDVGAKRIGGCILADGSIGSQTAALSQAYLNSESMGTLYQSDAFWEDFIGQAHKHNLQVAVHCIGDRAIRQINNVYLKLAKSHPKDLRHQLIHCELTDDALIAEIYTSGAVPVMQPNFDLLWGGENGFYTRKLGMERSKQMNRFNSMRKAGIRVTGGSDWYITVLDAPLSLQAAMQHHNPSERLSQAEAVDLYCANAAWLNGDENRKGSIQPGFEADFTVLSHALDDPQHKPRVLAVIRKGSIVYEAK